MPEDDIIQRRKNRYNVTAFGKEYTSLRHLAESHNIEASVVCKCIQAEDTPEEAEYTRGILNTV